MADIHDLKTLVLSFHPVIAIETVEESRVGALLRTVADELGMTLFEWTVTRGLVRLPGTAGIQATTDPAKLLRHIEELTIDGGRTSAIRQ